MRYGTAMVAAAVVLFTACSDDSVTNTGAAALNGTYELSQFTYDNGFRVVTESMFSPASHLTLTFSSNSEVRGEGFLEIPMATDTVYFIASETDEVTPKVQPQQFVGWYYVDNDTLSFRFQRSRGEGSWVETMYPPYATRYSVSPDRKVIRYEELGLIFTFRKR